MLMIFESIRLQYVGGGAIWVSPTWLTLNTIHWVKRDNVISCTFGKV